MFTFFLNKDSVKKVSLSLYIADVQNLLNNCIYSKQYEYAVLLGIIHPQVDTPSF
jgi:hypothetical protein